MSGKRPRAETTSETDEERRMSSCTYTFSSLIPQLLYYLYSCSQMRQIILLDATLPVLYCKRSLCTKRRTLFGTKLKEQTNSRRWW